MKITGIALENVRGFDRLPHTMLSGTINILVGANNSGKSTILNSIYLLQKPDALSRQDITIGQLGGRVLLFPTGLKESRSWIVQQYLKQDKVAFNLQTGEAFHDPKNGESIHTVPRIPVFPNYEPDNLVYPYLSKRKTAVYSSDVNQANSNNVLGNFENLFAKIDRLVTPEFQPGNADYIRACTSILGYVISSMADAKGKRAVYYIKNSEHIPLTSMGEGVVNIVGLIVDLCMAENKIFLIEEPENDIHPKALKALMNLIIEKSATNQFFVSTHSNIVMKYLGSALESKVFHVSNFERDSERPNLFLSKMEEVPNDAESRRRVLEDLGYDFFDFDMWKGWLFLEESSAEQIIREYLLKWFIPELKGKLRTFSANGTSSVETKFDDFNKLFVFLHLEPAYKNRVWVVIDGGKEEEAIITKMRDTYTKSGWSAESFDQLKEHDFESYYPAEFKEKVAEVMSISDKQKKRSAKATLLKELRAWIDDNEDMAKEQFKTSAAEVILKLKSINKKLKSK